jgi:hypothetical protein
MLFPHAVKFMMTRLKLRWLLVPLMMLAVQTARSQPAGAFSFPFPNDAANISLWDLSGDYTIDVPIGTDGLNDAAFSFHMDQNNVGQLSGAGIVFMTLAGDDENQVGGVYTVRGSVRTTASGTHVSFLVTISGIGPIAGFDNSYKLTVLYQADVTPGGMFGRLRTHMTIAGFGGASATDGGFGIDLPGAMDGSWTLDVNVGGLTNKKLLGTGVATLSNGRTAHFILKGSYNPLTDVEKLRLAGFGDGAGSKVKIDFLGSSETLLDISGKVLGQPLHSTFVP